MRRMTHSIGAAACLSLLIAQLSGAHAHIDDQGYVGAAETSHSHSHDGHGRHAGHRGHAASRDHDHDDSTQSGNDYGGAQDISLLDQTLTSSKIPVAVPALASFIALAPRAHTLASADVAYPVLSGRYTRWRPPLRAPPRFA